MIKIWKSLTELDRSMVLACQKFRYPLLTRFMRLTTYSASAPVWIVLLISLFLAKYINITTSTSDQLLLSLEPAIVACGIGHLIMRPLLRRPRPFIAIPKHEAIVWTPKNFSMPSTHAAISIAFFASLWLFEHPFASSIGIWAIIVVVSRLYLGVHYPSDLAVGSLLGLASAAGYHYYLW